MLIFGSIVLIVGLLALVVSAESREVEAVMGSLAIIALAIAIICVWAFLPSCELARVDTQVALGERFLVSEKVCYRNIRPSKTWTYIYFTEMKGVE